MNTLEKFIKFLQYYQDKGGYIGVIVCLPNQDKPELIINIPESLITKINYYHYTYNPDLTLKTNDNVRIVSYNWVQDFEMLQEIYLKYLYSEEI